MLFRSTKDTLPVLITKGYRGAKAVAIEANILNSATVGDVLAKANAQASALKAKIPETAEALAEKAEEKPADESKPEAAEKAKPAEEGKKEAPAEKAEKSEAEEKKEGANEEKAEEKKE